jgi:sigma-B regulation protein RsbU (phosphoserine phosphatase)
VLEDGRTLVAAAVLPAIVDDPSQPEGTGLLGVVASWFAGPVPVEVADVLATFGSVISAALHHASSRPQLARDAAEQRFRSLVDSVGAVIWEADPETFQASFASRRAEELLGYSLARWLEPGFWEGTVHPADRDYAVRYRQVATAEGGDHELEYRLVAADGREVWVDDLFHVELDEQGSARRLTGVMLDITRRKRVEQALLEGRERFASLARTLQASLLPPHLPEIFGLEVAARYRPAEDGVEVVGDFYDLFDVGDDGWGVVIGDVCGKGPEAAALTALARYTVRAAAIRERRPSRVLRVLSQAVLAEDLNERFCTAAYARVVPGDDRVSVELSCGGHPPPLVLRRDGSVHRAGRPGTLLGLFEAVELSDDAVELEPGDALVLFTDGATDAKRGGEVLGEERLRALVAACAGLPRAEDMAVRLEDGIVSFQDGGRQDDLAIVVLRVPG